MKLILLETVDGLGRPGDEVRVKDGFARNFLLPKRKAVRHNVDSLRMLARLRKKAEEEERALIASMEELAEKVSGLAIEVRARATEDRHLFGSVTEKDIHLAILAAGWDAVPLRAVRLSAHIKEAGEEQLELHLHGDIRAPYTLTVVPVDIDGDVIELRNAGEHADDGADDEDGDDDAPRAAEGASAGDTQDADAAAPAAT
jgi:large subunit ribosomal protein L9